MIDVAATELNGTTPGTPRDPYRELPPRYTRDRAAAAAPAAPFPGPAPIGIARGGVLVVYK